MAQIKLRKTVSGVRRLAGPPPPPPPPGAPPPGGVPPPGAPPLITRLERGGKCSVCLTCSNGIYVHS